MPTHRTVHRSLLLLTLAALAACGDKSSPEQQVRAVIEQMEQAAENRDVGDLKAHLSEEYRDANGMGAEAAARYARGYFIANQSIHLLTRVEELTFPTDGEARAQVLVGMLGRDAGAADQWDLAAEVHTFKIALRREDGQWKVTFLEVMRK
jgi:predicted small lipoprotein YifL